MLKIENYQTQIKVLKKQITNVEENYKDLVDKRSEDLRKIALEYFYTSDVLIEGDEIELRKDGFDILRSHPNYSYKKEICSVRLERDYAKPFNDIVVSCYSTNDSSDFELKRLITIGNVASVVLEDKNEILKEWNEVTNFYKDDLDENRTENWELQKLVKEADDQISLIKKNEMFTKLENVGIEFKGKHDEWRDKIVYPNLDTTAQNRYYGIKFLKVLSKSKSGKTVDISIKYNAHSDKYREQTIFKVRTRSLNYFLNANIDQMV